MTTRSGPFRVDEEHDASYASDGRSRYGVYVRQRLSMFEDLDGRTFTTDPVAFAAAAWDVATGPIMAPGYIQTGDGRITSTVCSRNNWDGTLLADITLATPRPAALAGLIGYTDWERPFGFDGAMSGPSEASVAKWPAMLTTTRLLLPIPTVHLHVPQDAPAEVSTLDAKASVQALAAVLNEALAPVLAALDGPPRSTR